MFRTVWVESTDWNLKLICFDLFDFSWCFLCNLSMWESSYLSLVLIIVTYNRFQQLFHLIITVFRLSTILTTWRSFFNNLVTKWFCFQFKRLNSFLYSVHLIFKVVDLVSYLIINWYLIFSLRNIRCQCWLWDWCILNI